jgi:hypothetical protein
LVPQTKIQAGWYHLGLFSTSILQSLFVFNLQKGPANMGLDLPQPQEQWVLKQKKLL